MKKILLLFMTTLALLSCSQKKPSSDSQKKGSSGKTLELLVVADNNIWNGSTKKLIDSLFSSPQVCLPVPESKFDVVNIPFSSYESTEMFRVHRNILLLDVNPSNPDKVYMHIDEYAAPQVIFDFAAKDAESLQAFLRKYEQSILREIYKAEHRRVHKAFEGLCGYEVNDAVKRQFGFNMMFSNEFAVAKQATDFAWIRKEAKDFGIGVLIDVRNYESRSAFDEQVILDHIDTIMHRYVPSSAPDSYMGLERRRDESGSYLAPIVSCPVDFGGSSYCVETRGCWRSFGDFMGGPFVSYTLLSPDQKRVVTLTGYVYCPRNKPWTKRDLLMQVESICWSLVF